MLYCLHILDKPGRIETRKRLVEEHRAYQRECGVEIVMSGPLLAEDGETMIGSMFLIEAGGKEDVEAFVAGDPFKQNDVWGEARLTRFFRRHG